METSKIIISRKGHTPIEKRELESLLSFYELGRPYDNAIISVEYIKSILEIAIDGLTEIVEDGLGDLN